jgi:hypothetical protein
MIVSLNLCHQVFYIFIMFQLDIASYVVISHVWLLVVAEVNFVKKRLVRF